MTSFRQIEANRSSALKSTGPNTHSAKQRAIASLDRGEGIPHHLVADWVTSREPKGVRLTEAPGQNRDGLVAS
jgi:hypothetical protein